MKSLDNHIGLKIIWSLIIGVLIIGLHQTANGDENVDRNTTSTGIPLLPAPENIGKVEGIQLLLSVDPIQIYSGAVSCRISLVNKTKHLITFPGSSFLSEYRFTVTDESGVALPLTEYGHTRYSSINNMVLFRFMTDGLKPGKSRTYLYPINRLFDMTKPGEYSVSVSREVIKPDDFIPGESPFLQKTVILTSNTVHIKIKPSIINNIAITPTTTASQSKDNAIPPSNQWQIGDQWKLNVDIFAPESVPLSPKESTEKYLNLEQRIAEGKARTLWNYTMTVKVTDITKVDGKEQVKLVFIPNDNSVRFVKDKRPEITIDRATHQLLKVEVPEHSSNYTSLLNNQPVIVHSVDGYSAGFPIDIIPQIAPSNTAQLSAKYDDMHLNVNRSSADGAQTLQEKLTVDGKDWFRVTQVWPAGSKWWSEYLKEDFSAQIGMRVRLTGDSQVKWGPVTNGLQLGVGSDDTSTYGGDAVRVHIALRNTLDQSVPAPSSFLGKNLQVKMIGNRGGITPLTELGKTAQAASINLFSAKIIPPHSVLSGDISLDKIYDLSRAGIYAISASTGNSSQKFEELESPILMIQVRNNDASEVVKE